MRDTGPGIPDDVLPHVFEPFFTTKPMGKGTGLGLAGSTAVQNHDGAIELINHPDGGLEVEIVLPLLDKLSSEQMHEILFEQSSHADRYRVLVIDDEEPIRMVLSKQLEQLGYAVVTANDGTDGLAKIADGEIIDAVVLDILMPGLSGTEVFDRYAENAVNYQLSFILAMADLVEDQPMISCRRSQRRVEQASPLSSAGRCLTTSRDEQ